MRLVASEVEGTIERERGHHQETVLVPNLGHPDANVAPHRVLSWKEETLHISPALLRLLLQTATTGRNLSQILNLRVRDPKVAFPTPGSFKCTGLLAAATKNVKKADGTTTVLKYHEPPEARKPSQGWRLYVFKGEEQSSTFKPS